MCIVYQTFKTTLSARVLCDGASKPLYVCMLCARPLKSVGLSVCVLGGRAERTSKETEDDGL